MLVDDNSRKFAYGFAFVFAAFAAASAYAAGTLPSGYTEVEYIQGNGYVRITTDYTPNPTTDKAEAVVEWPNGTLNNNQAVWCARVGSGANNASWTLFLLNSSGYKFRFDYSNAAGNYLTPAVAADTKYTVTVDRNVITWSGGEGQTHTEVAGFTAAGSPLQLFASHQNGIDSSLNNWGKHKLYSFKVWRSGELIHYFVPCKDANDVVTMVDICDTPATLTVKYAASAPAASRVFMAGPEGHYYDDSFFNTDSLLDIQGSPADIGTPSPAYGLLSNLTAGQTESVSCGMPVVTNASENLEYTCIGWKLYNYDGNVVDSGNTQSFTYTHPSPAEYRRLVWQWAVSSVKGTVTAGVGGSVAPSGTAWFAVNTPVTLTATPNAGKGFIIQQSFARVFEQADDAFEPCVAAEVGVGNVLRSRMVAQITCQRHHLRPFPIGQSLTRDLLVIGVVHGQNPVETVEVGRGVELPGAVPERVSVAAAVVAHAAVGQVAYVPTADACRVNDKTVCQSPAVHQVLHDTLRRRRTAYIAQADEEESCFHIR